LIPQTFEVHFGNLVPNI